MPLAQQTKLKGISVCYTEDANLEQVMQCHRNPTASSGHQTPTRELKIAYNHSEVNHLWHIHKFNHVVTATAIHLFLLLP